MSLFKQCLGILCLFYVSAAFLFAADKYNNNITGYASNILAGTNSTTSGLSSSSLGGDRNNVSGQFSVVGGANSVSAATGTFTWSDSANVIGVQTNNNILNHTWFKNRGGFSVTTSTNMADGGFFMRNNYVSIGTTTTNSTFTVNGTVTILSTVTAAAYAGDGSEITNLNASALSSGTVNDLRLSPNVSLLNSTQTATADKAFLNRVLVGTTTVAGSTATFTIYGNIRLVDGNEGAGRVLTGVDTAGFGVWRVPFVTGQNVYYLTPYASDIAGFFYMNVDISSTIAITTSTWAGIASDIVLSSYTTPAGYPGALRMPGGQVTLNLWLAKTGGTKDLSVYANVYRWDGSVRTLLATSELSPYITSTTPAKYTTSASIPNSVDWAASDRLQIIFYAHVTGTGSAPTLQAFKGGTYYEEVQVPAAVINAANYVVKDSSGNVDLDGHNLAAASITAVSLTVSSNVVITSTVSAPAFSLNGSTITSWADVGGGTASAIARREEYIVGTASANYTGSTTVFSMVSTFSANGYVLGVYYDGILMRGAGQDYTETTDSQITFVSPRVTGHTVSMRWYANPVASFGDAYLSGANTWSNTNIFNQPISGSITGNAGTVTNGIYTTGSYSDPSWITSLATSKIDLSTVTTAINQMVPLAGGNMTGQLTTASTMTVQGNAFSVGGSTLTVANGKVGVGMAPDTGQLTVLGIIKSSGSSNSLMFGDRGNSAHAFEWYSSGDIARLYSSVSAKDVAKISSLGALETSAHLVVNGELNHKGGAGIFISSSSTNWNFPNVNIVRGAGGVGTLAKYLNFTFPGDDLGSTTPGKEWAFWLAMSSFTATSQSDSSTNMSLMGPGKLGIGTTSPTVALDVVGAIKTSKGIVGNNTATQYGVGYTGEYSEQSNYFTNWLSTAVAAGVVYQTIRTNAGTDATVVLSSGIWEVNLEVSLWNGNSAVNIYSLGIGLSTDSGFSTFSDEVELGGSGGNLKYISCFDLTQARAGVIGGAFSRVYAVSSSTTLYPKMRIVSPSGVTFNVRAQLYATRIQ